MHRDGSAYPEQAKKTEPLPRIVITKHAELHLIEECLRAVGVAMGVARIVAEQLVEADLRGIHSHGIFVLSELIEDVLSGEINLKANPREVNWNG